MTRIIAAVLLAAYSLTAAGQEVVSVIYVGAQGDAYLGFRQALDEANRQGRFLGLSFTHERVADESATPPSERGHAETGYSAVFTTLDGRPFQRLANHYEGYPIVQLTSRSNALRQACVRNHFFAAPSEQMIEDALAQRAAAGKEAADIRVRAWNTEFRRYAAIQVSKRFEEGQGQAMSDDAYAGWAATRLVAQVIAQRRVFDPGELVEALHRDVEFDGAKGVPMQFRASGQLNQMLLFEKDGRVVGTAPVRGVHEPHELESLGFAGCLED